MTMIHTRSELQESFNKLAQAEGVGAERVLGAVLDSMSEASLGTMYRKVYAKICRRSPVVEARR